MTKNFTVKKMDQITDRLLTRLNPLRFSPPVTYVYNPLEYARDSWNRYVERFATGKREIVFLGMNPGPFGMAQTGIPFGEVAAVRDWMGICENVKKPKREHPKRPIEGFDCPKSEVSGRRLWGWIQKRFKKPEYFFKEAFVLNYCPLVFMSESGSNITPDKLSMKERAALFSACDEALLAMLEVLEPQWAIGVGAFAEERIRTVLVNNSLKKMPTIGRVLHPSPASPAANRDWEGTVEKELASLGLLGNH